MDISQAAVVTVTWARSAGEDVLLRRSLALLADSGLPVAVADAGASDTFTEFLRALPGFSVAVPSEQGLVAQVQAGFRLAATFGRRFILYVEPDKELFFDRRMHQFLQAAPVRRDVGVVLAARSTASFDTFPQMQRYTEAVINRLCAERIGTAGDYSYGPFLMNGALTPHLTDLEHRLGWGWRHFIFRAAVRQGLRVLHLEGDYRCPPVQRREDDADRVHRMRQLSQNILGLIE